MAQLVKNPPSMQETDLGSIAGLGRSPGEGKGYPLQYSGLENSMDWIAHGVEKSRTRLSHFHFQHSKELCTTPHIRAGGILGLWKNLEECGVRRKKFRRCCRLYLCAYLFILFGYAGSLLQHMGSSLGHVDLL